MNTATEVIPMKAKGNRVRGTPTAAGSATHGGDTNSATGGGCALCKKYSCSRSTAWEIYPTKDCRKMNSGGTSNHFSLARVVAIVMSMVSPLVE